jgi:hypothetical protein
MAKFLKILSGVITEAEEGGAASWQVITSDPNPASAGARYMANTSGGAFTITLPASPSASDRIVISDYSGTFDTYNLTVARNGKEIMGLEENLVLNLPDVTVTLDYIDATQGWKIV